MVAFLSASKGTQGNTHKHKHTKTHRRAHTHTKTQRRKDTKTHTHSTSHRPHIYIYIYIYVPVARRPQPPPPPPTVWARRGGGGLYGTVLNSIDPQPHPTMMDPPTHPTRFTVLPSIDPNPIGLYGHCATFFWQGACITVDPTPIPTGSGGVGTMDPPRQGLVDSPIPQGGGLTGLPSIDPTLACTLCYVL